jgi:hypothetical protein
VNKKRERKRGTTQRRGRLYGLDADLEEEATDKRLEFMLIAHVDADTSSQFDTKYMYVHIF